MARPSCLRLLTHWARRAASRAACTAGRSNAMSTAMIAITTSNSIRVKPRRRMEHSSQGGEGGTTTPSHSAGRAPGMNERHLKRVRRSEEREMVRNRTVLNGVSLEVVALHPQEGESIYLLLSQYLPDRRGTDRLGTIE